MVVQSHFIRQMPAHRVLMDIQRTYYTIHRRLETLGRFRPSMKTNWVSQCTRVHSNGNEERKKKWTPTHLANTNMFAGDCVYFWQIYWTAAFAAHAAKHIFRLCERWVEAHAKQFTWRRTRFSSSPCCPNEWPKCHRKANFYLLWIRITGCITLSGHRT